MLGIELAASFGAGAGQTCLKLGRYTTEHWCNCITNQKGLQVVPSHNRVFYYLGLKAKV